MIISIEVGAPSFYALCREISCDLLIVGENLELKFYLWQH